MAELVEKAGVKRETGYLYFLRGSDVYKKVAGRGREGVPLKVYIGTFAREEGFLYFLNKDGNIARARQRDVELVGHRWCGRAHRPAVGREPLDRHDRGYLRRRKRDSDHHPDGRRRRRARHRDERARNVPRRDRWLV